MAYAGILFYCVIVLLAAATAVLVTTRLLGRGARGVHSGRSPTTGNDILRHYRFREGYLLSDIDEDDGFLDPKIDRALALKRLTNTLGPLSPGLSDRLAALRERGESFLADGQIGVDPVVIGGRIEDGDVTVLWIGPTTERTGRQAVETATLNALQSELADLRAAFDGNSVPMWRRDRNAQIIWANGAYYDLVERLNAGETPGWPLPDIFASELDPSPDPGLPIRCKLDLPDRDDPNWFEVTGNALPGGSMLFTAQPVDGLMRAETSLRDFLQTTTKTFAALPIGLAVFDSKRQLVTFNPALAALTQAGAEFLSRRPDLTAFLDRLRDQRRMPEPRNYRTWRDEIARLEEGAETGTYQEMWELPEGKTFRVMGRPHPDGAIAFMFEDISAEVSLTRQFRADLEMFQAVLDTAPAAIVVFDADGAMIGANEGYKRFWGGGVVAMPHLTQASADWSERCKRSDVWDEVRQFVLHEADRDPMVREVETTTGIRVTLRIAATRGRATVIHFLPMDISLTDPLADLAMLAPAPVPDDGEHPPLKAARTA